MNRLTYTKLDPQNKAHCTDFASLMRFYAKELDSHKGTTTTDEVIAKWTDSIIEMQGESDRHLELCYDCEILIGFLYGKIDKPEHKGYKKIGYGYIMEFFVLLQYRRKGYGREMFYHLEKLFAKSNAKYMYLTADGITGKPFWQSLGFIATGEISSENRKEIYEKAITVSEKTKIKILKYPDDNILKFITNRCGDEHNIIASLTDTISMAHYNSDFFCVIMYKGDEIIGCANFFQSSSQPLKWLYADLLVIKKYRRQGFATEIVSTGLQYLSELNAKTLFCTVETYNKASLNLHSSLGFCKTETESFENFEVDGLIMFKKNIQTNFNIIPVADDFNHLVFICDLLVNKETAKALHIKTIPDNEYRQFYKEMREALVVNPDKNELNYIIRKGIVPIAWLKLNGLENANSLWISMLVVHHKYRNLGSGKYALEFAEKYAMSNNLKSIYIKTTADNIIALSLYQKSEYKIIGEEIVLNGDGTKSIKYTLRKEI